MKFNRCNPLTFGIVVALLAAGCAHQPTLDRAKRPFVAKGVRSAGSAFAIIEPTSQIAAATGQFKPVQAQTTSSPNRPITLPIRQAASVETATMQTQSLIKQTSTHSQGSGNHPATAQLTELDVQVVPPTSGNLLRPNLSFGFNDLKRDADMPVMIDIPPSMRQENAASDWSLGSAELADVSIEEL